MPPQQRVCRAFRSYGLGLSGQKNALSVGKPNSPSTQPLLEQSILRLKELNDRQLMTMNPARYHQ
jgi:hypothetical protein